jgi:hypothetical protein
MTELRKFVQSELHDIESQLDELKRMKVNPREDGHSVGGGADEVGYTVTTG